MSDSVRKAFKMLELLGDSGDVLNLAVVSRTLKMNKTTAYRYLETLTKLGAVEKTENGYRLGMTLFELGNQVPVKRLIVDRIDPWMRKLCAEVNETVNLAQWSNGKALYLHKIESKRSLQMRAVIGGELPLHGTALGKALLASMDDEELKAIVAGLELRPFTPTTITSRSALMKEIADVREKGYSLDPEEFERGLTCIAVPLSAPHYDFLGAMSISTPARRASRETLKRFAARLRSTQRAILDMLVQGNIAPGGRTNKPN